MKGLIKLFTFGCLIFSSGLLFAQSEEPTISQSEDIFSVTFNGVPGNVGLSGEITLDQLAEAKSLELFTTSELKNIEITGCRLIIAPKDAPATMYVIGYKLDLKESVLDHFTKLKVGDRIIIEGIKIKNLDDDTYVDCPPSVFTVI
jgi:hypothetical protein